MKYDVCSTNMLFEGDLMAPTSKSDLLKPLEKCLQKENILHEIPSTIDREKTRVIVDFMSVVRQFRRYSDMNTFEESFVKTLNTARSVCSMETMQFVYDSYI